MRTWYGITLDSQGCVRAIELADNGLSGNAFDLSGLSLPVAEILKLNNNQLTGPAPVLKMPNLAYLWLNNNQLEGPVPNYNDLPRLILLELAYNRFNRLPYVAFNLPQLETLDISNNQLQGTLPDFQQLPSLKVLFLWNNQLSGTIPNFSNLPLLETLQLGKNRLTGAVPNFNRLPRLKVMDLWVNQLTGRLPFFSNMPLLEKVDISNNHIEALSSMANLTGLKELIVNNNRLSFDDILLNLGRSLNTYKYVPQQPLGVQELVILEQGDAYTVDLQADPDPGTGTRFVWSKDGAFYRDQRSSRLTFSSVSQADAGVYTCQLSNSQVPDLTLESWPLEIQVKAGACIEGAFDYGFKDRVGTFVPQVSLPEADVRYRWEFGDGATSDRREGLHEYAADGRYQVCLTVSTACGSDTYCQEVRVGACDATDLQLEWVVALDGEIRDMETDDEGNTYVTGNGFWQKYDSEGQKLVSIIVSGASFEDIDVDAFGNVTLSGIGTGLLDFDPRSSGGVVTTNDSSTFFFIAKYQNNGVYEFAKIIAKVIDSQWPNRVSLIHSINQKGSFFFGGNFTNSISTVLRNGQSRKFDGASNKYSDNSFLGKTDQNGNLEQIFVVQEDEYHNIVDIEVSPNNEIFIVGDFWGSYVSFNYYLSNRLTINISGERNSYIAKFDERFMPIVAWPLAYTDVDGAFIDGITVDVFDNSWIWGGNFTSVLRGEPIELISKHNPSGSLIFLSPLEYTSRYSSTNDLAVDNLGNSYSVGSYTPYITLTYIETDSLIFNKLDPEGNSIFRYTYPRTGQLQQIGLDDRNNIYIGGFSRDESFNISLKKEALDYAPKGSFLAKYAQGCASTSCSARLRLADRQEASCGVANGAATLSIEGAQAPYDLRWSNGAIGTAITGLLAGNYSAYLTDAIGCRDTLQVNIPSLGGATPSTDFTFSQQRLDCGTVAVQFTDQSGNNPNQWEWTYGKGEGSGNVRNPNHVFTQPGTYEVCLTATNTCGQQTRCKTLTIVPPPQATVSLQTQAASCGFNNGAATLEVAGGTPPYRFNWLEHPELSGPSAQNLAPGAYAVAVSDDLGCSSTHTFEILDYGQTLPQAHFSFYLDDKTLEIDNQSLYGDQYEWRFGDGNASSLADPVYTYSATGAYTLCLIVSNNCGKDTLCKQIEVVEVASCAMEVSAIVQPDTCQLGTGRMTLSVQNNTGELSFQWDHDPQLVGNTAVQLKAGFYQATVTDSRGCFQSISVEVPDAGMPPVANFSYLQEGEAVVFTSLAEQGDRYFWDFGNGYYSNRENPTVESFDTAGTYWVTLIVSNDCGTDEIQLPVVFTPATGVADIWVEWGLRLFPNPVKDRLHLEANGHMPASVEAFDLLGRQVPLPAGSWSGNLFSLDVSALHAGPYLLRIRMRDETGWVRWIKK